MCLVAQSYPTLCNPRDCSPPSFSVHGILQARMLEWVAIPSSNWVEGEPFAEMGKPGDNKFRIRREVNSPLPLPFRALLSPACLLPSLYSFYASSWFLFLYLTPKCKDFLDLVIPSSLGKKGKTKPGWPHPSFTHHSPGESSLKSPAKALGILFLSSYCTMDAY